MGLASAIVAAGQDPERALILLEEAKSLPRGRDFKEQLEVQILHTRLAAGDAEGVLAAAKDGLRDRPGDGALRLVAARATLEAGNPRGAISLFEGILKDEPTNVTVAVWIAALLEQVSSKKEARAAYERARGLGDFATPAQLKQIAEGLQRLSSPR